MSKIVDSNQLKISPEFSKRIKHLIYESECSTKGDFSKSVNVDESIISRAEKFGIIPSLRTLIKIANKFELSLTFLIGIDRNNDFIPSELPSNFHARLDELIKENKINYNQLSKNMSFHRTYIYEWMREGTLPSIEYLFEIADYFKVSPDYLLGRTDYRV